ncbi:8553_t:CDS:2 [Cetraspora pellucida]|uniref:8553_t:CDS:1 n=1 Tax=Cetraspora pellucida TaxID=1433469 RepID=A0ACA9Q958_9GLOM|nr:8553_t:CDS:2 [Cetraspora pellucida]
MGHLKECNGGQSPSQTERSSIQSEIDLDQCRRVLLEFCQSLVREACQRVLLERLVRGSC